MYDVSLPDSRFPAVKTPNSGLWTIGRLLCERAQAHGGRPVLEEVLPAGEIGRRWTYRDLLNDVETVAASLVANHEKGARVAVYANNSPEWVVLELAAAFAGLVLVPVNPAFQARELEFILRDSQAEAIFFTETFRGNDMARIVEVVCSRVPSIRRKILITDVLRCSRDAISGGGPDMLPDDIAQIQYTSGTTGFPKGVRLHHHALVKNATDIMERLRLSHGDKVVHTMPLFHTAGCGILVLGAIGAGATMLLAPLFEPEMIVRLIDRERPGFLVGVPTMLIAIMSEATRSGRDVSSVNHVLSGGASVPPELVRTVRDRFGCVIQVMYGQTETSPGITMAWHDDTDQHVTETAGQPLSDIEVAIRDVATGQAQPIGTQGEIHTRGYHVMEGYHGNPEATRAAIDDEGWLRTGDLGHMDETGYLTITGRLKEMIIRGGENIFPAEIENAILEHQDISEAAVVGVPCPLLGEKVVCFLRAKGDRRPSGSELKSFLRSRLAAHKTPEDWIWIENWPLTASGKVQKFALVEHYEKGIAVA